MTKNAAVFKAAERSDKVSYAIRDIVIEAKMEEAKGTKMSWLNIGDPAVYGFRPPEKLVNAVREALAKNLSGYAPSPGDPELREAAARLEGCPAENVFVTQGLSEGIDFFFATFVNPGDKVLLPNPTYPLYITKANIYNAKTVTYRHDGNGEIDLADLEQKLPGARVLVVINPNNPMGAVYSENNLGKVVELCAQHGVPVFYDASYDRIILDGSYVDFRKIARGKVPFAYGSSLSKNFLYPGARIGWVAFHGEEWKEVKDAFLRMCNQRLSANWEFQKGAAASIADFSHLAQFRRDLLARKEAMLRTTAELPLSYPEPKGAFYAFIKVESEKWARKWESDPKADWEFARAAIREGVVVVPGSGFGKQEGVHFRIVFLPPAETMEIAFGKIGKLL